MDSAYLVLAEDNKNKVRATVVNPVSTALINTATKIWQRVSSVARKLEESYTHKKVGNQLKRSAE